MQPVFCCSAGISRRAGSGSLSPSSSRSRSPFAEPIETGDDWEYQAAAHIPQRNMGRRTLGRTLSVVMSMDGSPAGSRVSFGVQALVFRVEGCQQTFVLFAEMCCLCSPRLRLRKMARIATLCMLRVQQKAGRVRLEQSDMAGSCAPTRELHLQRTVLQCLTSMVL
jgi:hypothetical protein